MKKKFLALIALVAITFPAGALAADYIGSKGNLDLVRKGENIKTLYIVNNQVNIEADVSNDLYAAGQNIVIDGNVADDSFVASSNNITVNGSTGDSLKAAGQTININSNIGSDLFMAGTTLNFSKDSVVKDDLNAAGSFITIEGKVGNDFRFAGTTVEINGEIDGDAIINAETVKIGDRAVIKGTLNYKSPNEAQIASGAQIEDIRYNQTVERMNKQSVMTKLKDSFTSFSLLKLLAAIILGVILISVFPKTSDKIVKESYAEVGRNLLVGLISAIVVPIALLILLFSIFGYQISFLAGLTYLLIYMVSGAYASIAVGSFTLKLFEKKDYKADWRAVIIGNIVLALLALIPIVGWIVALIVFLIVLGSILKTGYASVKKAQR